MHQQAKKVFQGISIGIPHHQKGYIVYVPHKRKVVPSYNIVFDDNLSSVLAYTSQPYSLEIAM